MPTKRSKRFRSAKERIEKYPKVAELETAWYKKKGRRLWQGWTERYEGMVKERWHQKKDRSFIHTHTKIEKDTPYLSPPSPGDISKIFGKFFLHKDYNIRNFHIVSINNLGEVVGYFSFRMAEKLVEEAREKGPGTLSNELARQLDRFTSPKTPHSKIINRLKKMGLIVRITPMPGYKLEKGKFVKK